MTCNNKNCHESAAKATAPVPLQSASCGMTDRKDGSAGKSRPAV